MKKIVIDASVVAKWFNNEALTDKAIKIKDSFIEGKIDLYAPEHLVCEVGNSIWKNRALSVDDSVKAMNNLMDMGIGLQKLSTELASKTMKTAKDFSITYYDALYLQLSREMSLPLVSADTKLLSKAEGKFAVHLKDFI